MVDGVICKFVQVRDIQHCQERKSVWCPWLRPKRWHMTWGTLRSSHHLSPNIIHRLRGIVVALGYGIVVWISMGIVMSGYRISPRLNSAPLTHLNLWVGCPHELVGTSLRIPSCHITNHMSLIDIRSAHVDQWLTMNAWKWRGNCYVPDWCMHIGSASGYSNLGVWTLQWMPTIFLVEGTCANHAILSVIRSAICGTCRRYRVWD